MNYLDWNDQQVLDAVGNLGPGMVGRYLFERAEYLKARGEVFGPTITEGQDGAFVPSEAAMEDLTARGMAKEVTLTIETPKRGPGRPKKVA